MATFDSYNMAWDDNSKLRILALSWNKEFKFLPSFSDDLHKQIRRIVAETDKMSWSYGSYGMSLV